MTEDELELVATGPLGIITVLLLNTSAFAGFPSVVDLTVKEDPLGMVVLDSTVVTSSAWLAEANAIAQVADSTAPILLLCMAILLKGLKSDSRSTEFQDWPLPRLTHD
jgi:hypothetical protein